jgi:hypothetical protein
MHTIYSVNSNYSSSNEKYNSKPLKRKKKIEIIRKVIVFL